VSVTEAWEVYAVGASSVFAQQARTWAGYLVLLETHLESMLRWQS
jgi:hypothetical protein